MPAASSSDSAPMLNRLSGTATTPGTSAALGGSWFYDIPDPSPAPVGGGYDREAGTHEVRSALFAKSPARQSASLSTRGHTSPTRHVRVDMVPPTLRGAPIMTQRRVYRDHLGGEHPHDGAAPVVWRVSAYVIAVNRGKLLVAEPTFAPGRWDLPGGGVHPDEGIVDGAVRECWEETGHRFTPGALPVIHFMGENRFYLDPAVEPATSPFRHSLLFAMEGTAALEPDPAWQGAPEETRRVAWVDPKALSPANTHPIHWKALRIARLVAVHPDAVRSTTSEDAECIVDVTRAANAEYTG